MYSKGRNIIVCSCRKAAESIGTCHLRRSDCVQKYSKAEISLIKKSIYEPSAKYHQRNRILDIGENLDVSLFRRNVCGVAVSCGRGSHHANYFAAVNGSSLWPIGDLYGIRGEEFWHYENVVLPACCAPLSAPGGDAIVAVVQ